MKTTQLAWFADSPDAGDPACICSLCGECIGEDDAPVVRMFDSANNVEARFHRGCAMYLYSRASNPDDGDDRPWLNRR